MPNEYELWQKHFEKKTAIKSLGIVKNASIWWPNGEFGGRSSHFGIIELYKSFTKLIYLV